MKIKTVLFVDDEVSILNTLKRLLRNENYHLLTATSAQQALELLNQYCVNIVVSDMRMPHVGGAEFLEQVKLKHPAVSRMIMSGDADLESVVNTINHEDIKQIISKPWDNDTLKKTIASHLTSNQNTIGDSHEDSITTHKLKQAINVQKREINELQKKLEEFIHKI